ncbi:alpha/beta fold hydrolase [Alsobacter sp. KACC 23698]|uniref:Alpha/beta fold hydrolase n=1 Tax=Alsobacter sp. KACC 23698 TaxID=3149229 RepID=A0AAU7JE96_9HYPH
MPPRRTPGRLRDLLPGLAALLLIGTSVWRLEAARDGVAIEALTLGETPVTVFRPAEPTPGPAVVIAHGFAGSQQLMQSFALTFARNGYVAVTFDFPGHGRHPRPMAGAGGESGSAGLEAELDRVAPVARGLGDGRLALLGHSMASDIVVRSGGATPGVGAVVAVSMFSRSVTPESPPNLLVMAGQWEGPLRGEALRVVGQVVGPERARERETVGDFAAGTARRAVIIPHVEHIGALYAVDGLREALAWLDQAFGRQRAGPPRLESRGPWILLLLAGAVLLGKTVAGLLPVVSPQPAGTGLRGRELWLLAVPMLLTPLALRVIPTHVLPVLVGDYLAAHFAAYGAVTAACILAVRRRRPAGPAGPVSLAALATGVAALSLYAAAALFWPLDRYATSFALGPSRIVLVLAMLAGTLSFSLANEWLTRGPGASRLAYPLSQAAFLASLALAVGLDFHRLFFLVIIVPVMAPVLMAFGLLSRWTYDRTGSPLVAGAVSGLAFAWAIGVTFPLLAA